MIRKFSVMAAVAFLSLYQALALPEAEAPDRATEVKRIIDGLHYQQGEITLKGNLAKLNVTSDFRYLDGRQTEVVLNKVWNNPPSEEPLGMLLPAEVNLLDENAWVVIIRYREEGYVKDDDAAKIDYDDLLKKMRAQVHDSNAEREKEGYPAMELVGWAAPPRYDQSTHKMYWAKELQVAGDPNHELNYNIRMLGRKGVLELNAIAAIDHLTEVEAATPSILKMVNFQDGSRYVDFNPSTDKVATYGLVGLIAGGILAKAGGFKLLLAGLLAAKKFVLIGIVAVSAWVKKLIANFRGQRQDPPSSLG